MAYEGYAWCEICDQFTTGYYKCDLCKEERTAETSRGRWRVDALHTPNTTRLLLPASCAPEVIPTIDLGAVEAVRD